jgi:N utilization substance protein B
MLTRHASRELALQSLFNIDFRFNLGEELDKDILGSIYENIFIYLYKKEVEGVDEFSRNLFFGILENLSSIDEIITQSTSSWGLEKTAIIDRSILRLAIYEMLFFNSDTPTRVVINEAIELAKTFGQKKSFKFVSGVLGNIYEASGLKEKDDRVDEKKQDKEYEGAVEEGKIGAMVFSQKDGQFYIAFLKNLFGFWTLPKGSIDNPEISSEESAIEKVKQKIGLDIKILEKIGESVYRDRGENRIPINKKAVYFLAESEYTEFILEKGNKGLREAKWINIGDLDSIKKYEELSPIFEKGLEIINKKND